MPNMSKSVIGYKIWTLISDLLEGIGATGHLILTTFALPDSGCHSLDLVLAAECACVVVSENILNACSRI